MKFISITKSINIRPDWPNISGAVLKAGTPLDITGAVANSSAAVGILADDAEKSSAEVAVVTEGSIDLAEITASYGELTDDAIAAIKGIAFIGSDGNPIVPSAGGGGAAPTIFLRADVVSADPIEFELTQDSQEAMLTEPDWRFKNPIVTLGLYSGNSLLKLVRLFWNGEIDIYMPGDVGAGEYQSLVTEVDSFGQLYVRLRRLEDGYAVRFTSLASGDDSVPGGNVGGGDTPD